MAPLEIKYRGLSLEIFSRVCSLKELTGSDVPSGSQHGHFKRNGYASGNFIKT
jgi:hypothetical protein